MSNEIRVVIMDDLDDDSGTREISGVLKNHLELKDDFEITPKLFPISNITREEQKGAVKDWLKHNWVNYDVFLIDMLLYGDEDTGIPIGLEVMNELRNDSTYRDDIEKKKKLICFVTGYTDNTTILTKKNEFDRKVYYVLTKPKNGNIGGKKRSRCPLESECPKYSDLGENTICREVCIARLLLKYKNNKDGGTTN